MEHMWCIAILEFLSDFRRFDNGDFISTLLIPKDWKVNDLKAALPLICGSVLIRKHKWL